MKKLIKIYWKTKENFDCGNKFQRYLTTHVFISAGKAQSWAPLHTRHSFSLFFLLKQRNKNRSQIRLQDDNIPQLLLTQRPITRSSFFLVRYDRCIWCVCVRSTLPLYIYCEKETKTYFP